METDLLFPKHSRFSSVENNMMKLLIFFFFALLCARDFISVKTAKEPPESNVCVLTNAAKCGQAS